MSSFCETDPPANATCSEMSKDLINNGYKRLCSIDGDSSVFDGSVCKPFKRSQNLLQFLWVHAVISRSAVLQALRERDGIDGEDEDVGKQWVELALVVGASRKKHILTVTEDLSRSGSVPDPGGFRILFQLFRKWLASGPVSVVSERHVGVVGDVSTPAKFRCHTRFARARFTGNEIGGHTSPVPFPFL
jgi:hypothetical protein